MCMVCAWYVHGISMCIAWSQGRTLQGFEHESECIQGSTDLTAATSVLRVLRVVKLLRL